MKMLILLILMIPAMAAADWPETREDCLAANIYFEARGELLVGMYMVGFVTMNRVRSPDYPSTICEVVKQHKQFSWYNPSRERFPKDREAWDRACSVAAKFLLNRPSVSVDYSEGAMYYHSRRIRPRWAREKIYIGTVGNHKFYR